MVTDPSTDSERFCLTTRPPLLVYPANNVSSLPFTILFWFFFCPIETGSNNWHSSVNRSPVRPAWVNGCSIDRSEIDRCVTRARYLIPLSISSAGNEVTLFARTLPSPSKHRWIVSLRTAELSAALDYPNPRTRKSTDGKNARPRASENRTETLSVVHTDRYILFRISRSSFCNKDTDRAVM